MRKYKIVFIDDEKAIIEQIMEAVKGIVVKSHGLDLQYHVFSNREEIEGIHNAAADIVLFDCAMGGTNLYFEDKDESTFGIELMKKFREKNKRTKIIFYSGGFQLEGSQCYEFTNSEMLKLINDLHIFKMIPKNLEEISKAIIEALEELDAIIIGLEDLKYEYDNMGLFHVNNKDYSIAQLIEELKNGTEVGECFKNNVYKLTLTYLMKFGGDE